MEDSEFEALIHSMACYPLSVAIIEGSWMVYRLDPQTYDAERVFCVPLLLMQESTEQQMKEYCQKKIAAWEKIRAPFDQTIAQKKQEYIQRLSTLHPYDLYVLYLDQDHRRELCGVPEATVAKLKTDAIRDVLDQAGYFITRSGCFGRYKIISIS